MNLPEKILNHLQEHGTITEAQAAKMGTHCLPKHISKLNRQGYDIKHETKTISTNPFAFRRTEAVYRL